MNTQPSKSERLDNLDYLRGLSAFCIMIYHYTTWSFGAWDARSFLGRIGIYGVAIFYIISGLTLAHVYQRGLLFSTKGLLEFFKKRIHRIYPLLWVATLTSILLGKRIPNLLDLLLNITGLFGLLSGTLILPLARGPLEMSWFFTRYFQYCCSFLIGTKP